MQSRLTFLVFSGLTVASILVRPAAAQEAEFFRFQFESQLSEVNQSASALLAELVQHPKEARDAALIVSQYPELIVRLRHADRTAPGTLGALTLNYPPEVSVAAATLMLYPDVLDTMISRLTATGLLGQVYARNRETVEMAMDRLSERTAELVSATLDAWQRRLDGNQAASLQFFQVRQPHALIASPSEQVAVVQLETSLPSAALVTRILENADQYPDLAAAIVDQWERERNPESFRRAVDVWFARCRDVLPNSFIGDTSELAVMLSEHARFEREFARQHAGYESDASSSDRLAFLHEHAETYPMLREVYYQKQAALAEARRPRIGGAPYTSGGGGSGARSSSSRASGTRTTPTRTATRTPGSTEGGAGGGQQGGFGGQQGGFGGQQGGFGGAGGQGGFGGSRGGGAGGIGGGGRGGIGSGSSGFGAGSGGGGRQSGANRISGSSNRQNRSGGSGAGGG